MILFAFCKFICVFYEFIFFFDILWKESVVFSCYRKNLFRTKCFKIPFKDSLSLENWPEGVLVKRFYSVPLNTGKISHKISESSTDSIKEHSIAQD